jgi:nucleoside-diphosphate-sugar epimerase
VASGHDVRVIGRRSDISIDGAEYRSCDITDYDAVREAIRSMEAVVHLAAIPSPAGHSGHTVFTVNCTGSVNVYEAAAEEGIRRVVSASSINAVGYFYGCVEWQLSYLPVDEAHPQVTTDSYSFSKQVLEEIAAYYWRRDGISGTTLRLPGVYRPTPERLERIQESIRRGKSRYPEIFTLPPADYDAFMQGLRSTTKKIRDQRLMEQRGMLGDVGTEEQRHLFGQIHNMFTNVDARDSAQAIEKSVLADYQGSHPLFINDSHNAVGVDSAALAKHFYPGVPLSHPLEGTETLVSIHRARNLIGYEPEFSVSRFYSEP